MRYKRTQVWGTLRRYLTYTSAGIVLMGGVGAFAARGPSVIDSVTAAEFSGLTIAQRGFGGMSALNADEIFPAWAQRIPVSAANAALALGASSTGVPFVAAPAIAALAPGGALDAPAMAAAEDPAPVAATPEPTRIAAIDHVAAEFGMDAGRQDWRAGDGTLAEANRDIQKVIEVRRGDTLFGLLVDAGLSSEDAENAVGALADVFSPRNLKAGQEITLNFSTAAGGQQQADGPQFVGLTLEPSVERDVLLKRDASGGLVAASVEKSLTESRARAAGAISLSLYDAAMKAHLPSSVVADVIKAYSYDVDFQRDIQPGDSFEVVYERIENEDGELARTGRLLYAALTLSGEAKPIYWFERDGAGAFYRPTGEAVRRSLLATPIDGARITSGFGMRKHPIQGYTKMHKGVDFGAPTGTPIYAAGSGTIAEIGRKGAYGNYIRIRHDGSYQTAYAHISRFANGLKRGARVTQGQIIAYVGSTGQSTGPHLHFEVLVDGEQVNPKKVKTTTGSKLAGAELKAFKAQTASLDAERMYLRSTTEIATRPMTDAGSACVSTKGCEN